MPLNPSSFANHQYPALLVWLLDFLGKCPKPIFKSGLEGKKPQLPWQLHYMLRPTAVKWGFRILKPQARVPHQGLSVREGNRVPVTPLPSLPSESLLHRAALLWKSLPPSHKLEEAEHPPSSLAPTKHSCCSFWRFPCERTSTLTQEKPASFPPALEVEPVPRGSPAVRDCLPLSRRRGFPPAAASC